MHRIQSKLAILAALAATATLPAADTPAAPDNTGRNVRDRDAAATTPLDQGNNRLDLDTSARIRQEVLANDRLSMNGRNVKIITRDGRVTLRGPVDSPEEKRLIGDIARRAVRPENVDDQLEVKGGAAATHHPAQP